MENREQMINQYISQITDTFYDMNGIMDEPDFKELETEAKMAYAEGEPFPSRHGSMDDFMKNKITDKLCELMNKIEAIDEPNGPDWLREEMAEKGITFDFDKEEDREAWQNAVELFYCQVGVQTLDAWRKDWGAWSIADEVLGD